MAIETESRRPLRSRPVLRRRGLPFQARIVVFALAGGLPALIAALVLLRDAPITGSVHRLIVVLLLGAWIGFALAVLPFEMLRFQAWRARDAVRDARGRPVPAYRLVPVGTAP